MNKRIVLGTVAIIFLAGLTKGHTEEGVAGAIKASISESCSCNPACPCMFFSEFTNETCEGSRLYEIEEANYGEVSLDGLDVVVTFSVGQWVRYYVEENATDEQLAAVEPLIRSASPVFDTNVLSIERAPISIEKAEDRIRFSVPASTVEIERMGGLNGSSIMIENLPFPDLDNYVQFESVENSHKAADYEFRHSGTNGFTSSVDLSFGDER